MGIDSDISHPNTVPDLNAYRGIVLSGGPNSVYSSDAPRVSEQIWTHGIPILGICYGHQWLAQAIGGRVQSAPPEYGQTALTVLDHGRLLDGLNPLEIVWMSHSDAVVELPETAIVLAQTDQTPIAAFADDTRRLYGLQWHPEVHHTPSGPKVIDNFIKICGLEPQQREPVLPRLTREIQEKVGKRKVFFFVSGGVDSTVAFTLCANALPRQQLIGIYVDTGLMRKWETGDLVRMFDDLGFADQLVVCHEAERFLRALEKITDPEEKRLIIGRLFVETQSRIINELGISSNWLLGQGTIYPDVIESGKGDAATIKTHHNQCPEIQELIAKGRVIEPLREFYKDQVRSIGYQIGLAEEFVERWPFPGPGLAIRCLCTDLDEPVTAVLGDHDDFSVYQVPVRSVGVQGDSRTYRPTMAVRSLMPHKDMHHHLRALARHYHGARIISYLAGDIDLALGRVRPALLTNRRIAKLRDADHVVRIAMEDAGLVDQVWQFPVVLLPLWFGDGETIVLRPIESRDGMTANFANLPISVMETICQRILEINGIAAVFLDASDKPPATIEWE
jgi:GMP synthase (glutamine-hydrolysing)